MTNKTTIDGIDVSKCESFYAPNACYSSQTMFMECERNTNCKFKQLARAKEEIEKWKHQAELGSDTTDRLSKQLENKEQECEELKEKINKYSKINEQDTRDFAKYKQALDEIEKYCSDIIADRYHYSTGAVLIATKLTNDIINKAKEQ